MESSDLRENEEVWKNSYLVKSLSTLLSEIIAENKANSKGKPSKIII